MNHVCVDGKFIPVGQPVLAVDNKSYRYGDGLFETLKVFDGKILLESLHFERFFSSLNTLGIPVPVHFTADKIKSLILQLCERNRCGPLARVRLTVFRGNGGIYDGDMDLHYTIEAWPLTLAVNQLNENGLIIGIFPDAQKSCDQFARIKSANYLPYVMAAKFAKEQHWNDALVLNVYGRIADATIANVFIVSNGIVKTPPLTEGCIAGVMRTWLLEQMPVQEEPLAIADIMEADEIFLTNAVSGMRWIKTIGEKTYSREKIIEIFSKHVQTFY